MTKEKWQAMTDEEKTSYMRKVFKAMNIGESFDYAETYFMTAVALMRGKKPFLAQRADSNKAVSYLETACELEEKPIYRQMLGYIKQDYFDRKYLNVSPSTDEEYARAEELGLNDDDINTLVSLLNIKES